MIRLRSLRALVALCAISAAFAAPAAADPELTVCMPLDAACVTVDPGLCGDGRVCVDPRVAACVLPAGVGDVCLAPKPLGGIERPATGSITISGTASGAVTVAYTGVFDQSLNLFDCALSAPAEKTVRCVSVSYSYDWYCAGWVVTATAQPFVTYNSQVAAQASCADHQGFPSGSPNQTLYTDFAFSGETKTNQAFGLSWFVQDAITCQAWGYSAGPAPMGDWTVTCDEPGANAPR